MINKIKSQINKPENKKLLSNFTSLSVLQVVSYSLQLFVLPYIIIILGIEKFGIVIYAQAIISYFIVFTDYGFNLSATRDISMNINNHERISEIFNIVLFTKIILGLFSLFIFSIIIFVFPTLKKESVFYYLSFTMVIGQIIYPIWFFQGIEKMKFITILNITSNLIFTGLIFLLVKIPSDYVYVNLFIGLGSIISSVISIIFIKNRFNIKLKLPTILQIKYELKNGWHILLSSFSINIYTKSNIIILGFFTNTLVLGYYSIAEKTMFIIRQLIAIFSRVTYPHTCKLGQIGHGKLIHFYKKTFMPFFVFVIICCFSLFLFSDILVLFLTKSNNPQISNLIKLLSFIPIVIVINIPAYQTLLAYDLKKSYSLILVTGSLLNIVLNTFLSFYLKAVGTCISIIITELFITIGLYLILEIKHKKYSLFYS